MYSLFAVSDASTDLWQACNSAISKPNDLVEDSIPFNPANDPRVDVFPAKASSLTQLSAMREFGLPIAPGSYLAAFRDPSNSNVFEQHHDPGNRPSGAVLGGMGPYSPAGISSQPPEHSLLLQHAHRPACVPPFDPCSSPALDDMPYQQLCGTPEHVRLCSSSKMRAEGSMSPHHMTASQYLGMAMHSPQPCMRSWADTVSTSTSAPSSPQPMHGEVSPSPLNMFVPGQQPPPPPPPVPPPPPPPPRLPGQRPRSSTGGSSNPATPPTPLGPRLQSFAATGMGHPSLQDNLGQLMPAYATQHLAPGMVQPPTTGGNQSCGPARGAISCQYDVAPGVAALLSSGRNVSGPRVPQASSSYARLVQAGLDRDTACNVSDGFKIGMPPAVLIGNSALLGSGAPGIMHSPNVLAGIDGLDDATSLLHAASLLPVSATASASDIPGTPSAPVALLAGRHVMSCSRLKRSSSGADSYSSGRDPSLGGALPTVSRLSSSAAGNQLARLSSEAGANSPGASKALAWVPGEKCAGIPPSQLMFMEMHDADCSSYCLGGNLEPHKMWFGVGVHRQASVYSDSSASSTKRVGHCM